MRAHVYTRRRNRWAPLLRAVALGSATVVVALTALPVRAGAAITTSMGATSSYYEFDANPATLAGQGRAEATAGSQGGLAILDFGRPAFDGSSDGMIDFSGQFVSLSTVEVAVESYLRSYAASARRGSRLSVAVGTNNSCSTGQPCGSVICGCSDEPPDFVVWGAHFGASVRRLRSWATSMKSHSVQIKVVAGDDAEPANDPGYSNTAGVLRGYADAVAGFQPSMVDYGSGEPGYWTLDQLYQVAYGFKPDLPFPEIYFASDVTDWTALAAYARTRYKVTMTVFGVLTDSPIGDSPQSASSQLLDGMRQLTGQSRVQWASNIPPLL
jgi:hypothetical protein